jgi:hypothetical protein
MHNAHDPNVVIPSECYYEPAAGAVQNMGCCSTATNLAASVLLLEMEA